MEKPRPEMLPAPYGPWWKGFNAGFIWACLLLAFSLMFTGSEVTPGYMISLAVSYWGVCFVWLLIKYHQMRKKL